MKANRKQTKTVTEQLSSHKISSRRSIRLLTLRRKSKQPDEQNIQSKQFFWNEQYIRQVVDDIMYKSLEHSILCTQAPKVIQHMLGTIQVVDSVHKEAEYFRQSFKEDQQPQNQRIVIIKIGVNQVLEKPAMQVVFLNKKQNNQREYKQKNPILQIMNTTSQPLQAKKFIKQPLIRLQTEINQQNDPFAYEYRKVTELKEDFFKESQKKKNYPDGKTKPTRRLGVFAYGYCGEPLKVKLTKKHIRKHEQEQLMRSRIQSNEIKKKIFKRMHIQVIPNANGDVSVDNFFDNRNEIKHEFDRAVQLSMCQRFITEVEPFTDRNNTLKPIKHGISIRKVSLKPLSFTNASEF